jgi:outer membrane protein, heavy metal efflux system
MRRCDLAACGAALLALAAPAMGETTTAPDIVLDQLVTEALRENPQLKSMRARVDAMRQRPAQSSSLPNPMLTYGAMGPRDDYRFPDSEEKRVGVEQMFPWFGKRALRGEIAEKIAEAMQGEYVAMRRDVVMTVTESYFELYALGQALSITRAQEDVLKRMEQTAQTKYATGSVEQQDVVKAQAEFTMLRQRLIDLEQQENVLRAKLNRLLNRPADSPLGRPATPPPGAAAPDMKLLMEQAERSRPEIAVTRIRAEQAGLERRLMAREYFPDLKLGVESRSFREGDDMVMAMVGVELPLWRGRNRAGVREAEKMAEAAGADLEAARRETAYDVQDAHYKLTAARRTLDLYREALLPQAEARFAASEAGYRTGKVDFLDLLESERFLLETRVMAATAEGEVGMQWARLERAVGGGEGVR